MRLSTIGALIGGGVMALASAALHIIPYETQSTVYDPLGVIAMILLALGLPALYLGERQWFSTLAKVGFGIMAVGWIGAAFAMPLAVYGPEMMFFGFLLGLLVAMIGAFVFGVAALRSDEVTIPRLGAWLLVAALPVGLLFTILVNGYVIAGYTAPPWAGPMLLYGLAWVVFADYLRTPRMGQTADDAIPQ